MMRASRSGLGGLGRWLLFRHWDPTAIVVSLILAVCVGSGVPAHATTVYWDTTSGSLANWSSSNWNTESSGLSGGTISSWPSGSDAVFSVGTAGLANLQVSITGSETIGNLTVIESNVSLTGSGNFVLASSSATWTAKAGAILVVDTNVASTGQFTVGGAGNSTYAGIISGGNLVKTGSGLLTLEGANTLLGTTTISGGTIDLAQANALQLSTLVAPSPGSLVFDRSVSFRLFDIGGLSGSGNIALHNSSGTAAITLSVGGNASSTTYSGVLSSSGGLTKIGNGTLALINSCTFTGGTTISGGTIQLGTGASGFDGVLPASGGILDNAALA